MYMDIYIIWIWIWIYMYVYMDIHIYMGFPKKCEILQIPPSHHGCQCTTDILEWLSINLM